MRIHHYWRILKSQSRPVRFLLAQLLVRTRLSRIFLIHQPGYRLRFFPSSVSVALWIDPRPWAADQAWIQRYLKPGDRMVDVGANVGSVALAASLAVGDTGNVLAIEPDPRIAGFLTANAKLNGRVNVTVCCAAVGATHEVAGLSQLRTDDQNFVVDASVASLLVPVVPLDTLVGAEASIALIKLDVEGYELSVLRGARQVLSRTECVFFESWDQHCARYGHTSSDVIEFLSGLEFQVLSFHGRDLEPVAAGYRSVGCENLVAVRRLELLQERLQGLWGQRLA